METKELLLTAARGLGVYVFMLVIIRVLGKRTVGNFTAFDLLVALMLGELVDEIIYGDVTVLQGAIALTVVAAAKYATAWLSYSSPTLTRILEGKPTPVVRNGALDRKGMREELMSDQDVMAGLRLEGIDDVREVKLATIEVDGEMSVIRRKWAEPAQKADLDPSHAADRDSVTNGRDEPPPSKRTDSNKALGG